MMTITYIETSNVKYYKYSYCLINEQTNTSAFFLIFGIVYFKPVFPFRLLIPNDVYLSQTLR